MDVFWPLCSDKMDPCSTFSYSIKTDDVAFLKLSGENSVTLKLIKNTA